MSKTYGQRSDDTTTKLINDLRPRVSCLGASVYVEEEDVSGTSVPCASVGQVTVLLTSGEPCLPSYQTMPQPQPSYQPKPTLQPQPQPQPSYQPKPMPQSQPSYQPMPQPMPPPQLSYQLKPMPQL
ncbi:procyclic form-specific polypeptide B-alpha-like [Acanthopagrus latus]|uniref:procyclic form-specific polypeptide B-alpha-like n=1 Tax=Acanthopagrus latus TaxID=8177 RepID=UPI00187D06D0|nr:procyclic form-specific polypeptide B-alpha-like [Acanthopagrus latus]